MKKTNKKKLQSARTFPDQSQGLEEFERGIRIHKTALIDISLDKIGNNVIVWAYSHLMQGSTIGNDTTIGQNVVIGKNVCVGHSCKLQDDVKLYEGTIVDDLVFIGPGTKILNDYFPVMRNIINCKQDRLKTTWIQSETSLGGNVTIRPGITIHKGSIIGCGSVVLKNVKPNCVYVGNPAKKIRKIKNIDKELERVKKIKILK